MDTEYLKRELFALREKVDNLISELDSGFKKKPRGTKKKKDETLRKTTAENEKISIVTKLYYDKYVKAFGARPAMNDPKQVGIVKRLVKSYSVEHLERVIEMAFLLEEPFLVRRQYDWVGIEQCLQKIQYAIDKGVESVTYVHSKNPFSSLDRKYGKDSK